MPEQRTSETLLLDIVQQLAIVQTQVTSVLKGQERADDSRKAIHDKLEQFARVAETVKRIEPIVEQLQQLRLQGEGAAQLSGVFAKALYAIIGAAIAVAGWLASSMMGGRHP